jgi:hypothetical protein
MTSEDQKVDIVPGLFYMFACKHAPLRILANVPAEVVVDRTFQISFFDDSPNLKIPNEFGFDALTNEGLNIL